VGRLGSVQRKIHVERIDARGKHAKALGVDPSRQVVAGLAHRQDVDVVTGPDVEVHLWDPGQFDMDRWISELRPKVGFLDRLPHDLAMAAGRVHHPLLARPETEEEQCSRLPAGTGCRHTVVDRLGNEAE
jgi:hypothetical protein